MMYNKGCYYCYRRAAMESGVNNKLVAEKVWYTGEILRIKDSDIAKLNENGGLRIQSFGDWQPHFSAQLADILYDAELRGLQVKIITKEPSMIEYVAKLKEQGLGKSVYFNLSADYAIERGPEKFSNAGDNGFEQINPSRPYGRDAGGQVWWKRAMTVEEAYAYRQKYPWVNVRIVATDLNEFIRGLKDPKVQVVTGYHGNIREWERVDSATGEFKVNVEPLGDNGMPTFAFVDGRWVKEDPGKTKTHKALAQAIEENNLQLDYYNKTCCITGHCASCKGKCGKIADSFYTKNANNLDDDSKAYWVEHLNRKQLFEYKEQGKYSDRDYFSNDDFKELRKDNLLVDALYQTIYSAAPSWNSRKLEALYKEHPELDYIERLQQKDKSAKTELQDLVNSINDAKLLDDFRWFIGEGHSDTYTKVHTAYGDLYDKISYKKTHAKGIKDFRAIIDARMVDLKDNGGHSWGWTNNQEFTVAEIRDLYNKYNTYADAAPLAEKVFSIAEKLNIAIKASNAQSKNARTGDQTLRGFYLGNRSLETGRSGLVSYTTDIFNGKEYSDTRKAQTLLHELIHACTSYAYYADQMNIDLSNWSIFESLDNIYRKIAYGRETALSDIRKQYGLTDKLEFLAEMSNPEFREGLSKLKVNDLDLYLQTLGVMGREIGLDPNKSYDQNVLAVLDAILDNFDMRLYDKMSDRRIYQNTKVKYNDRISYDSLVAKPPLKITSVDMTNVSSRSDTKRNAKRNALKFGTSYDDGSVSVYVADIDKNVLLGKDGLEHGLQRGSNLSITSPITQNIGEILTNSIKINELVTRKDNILKSYILLGVCSDGDNLYLVRSVVDSFDRVENYDVLYAVNTKKETAVLNAPQVSRPDSVSSISVTDLLNLVNKNYPSILPATVLQHYGYTSRPKGQFSDDALFSVREEEPPKNTKTAYKLMRLVDGKLYPLFIGNNEEIAVGTWYNADSPNLSMLSGLAPGTHMIDMKTGEAISWEDYAEEHVPRNSKGKFKRSQPNVDDIHWANENGYRFMFIKDNAGGNKTSVNSSLVRYGDTRSYYNWGVNGSKDSETGEGSASLYALRPGFHFGATPSMRQIGYEGADGVKDMRLDNQVWVEVEMAADVDYNEEARSNHDGDIPTHIPENGYYTYATNPTQKKTKAGNTASDSEKADWYVAGAFKVTRILSDTEADEIVAQYNKENGKNIPRDFGRANGRVFNAKTMSLEDGVRYSSRADVELGTLFSGADTFASALDGLIHAQFAAENRPEIVAVYKLNHGGVVLNDVLAIDPHELPDVQHLQVSPPCTNLSAMNNDRGEKPIDIALARKVAEIILVKKPRAITVENVEGYMTSKSMNIIREALRRAGYKSVDIATYKDSEYGGFTNRERVILRAMRDEELPPVRGKVDKARGWGEAVGLEYLNNLPDAKTVNPRMVNSLKTLSGIDPYKVNRPLLVFGESYKNKTFGHAYFDQTLPTIIAESGASRVFMPDGTVKEVTPDMLAKLMGLDGFKLPKYKVIARRVIGNGIPAAITTNVMGPVIETIKADNEARIARGESIRYSQRDNNTDYAPTFYSKMGKVIDDIKPQKMGANGVIPYLKGKGVKDEEIKWSGIATFLEGKKSLTKAELQEFAKNSMLQVEEETKGFYGDNERIKALRKEARDAKHRATIYLTM